MHRRATTAVFGGLRRGYDKYNDDDTYYNNDTDKDDTDDTPVIVTSCTSSVDEFDPLHNNCHVNRGGDRNVSSSFHVENDGLLSPPTTNKEVFESTSHTTNVEIDTINSNDDDTVNDGITITSSKSIRRNRIQMTILHYFMTYPQWSIALFIFFASITSPIPTTKHQIVEPLVNLQTVLQTESQLYYNCVRDGYDNHERHMNVAVHKEIHRVHQYRTTTVHPHLQAIVNRTNQCTNVTNAAVRAIQTWHNAYQQIIPFRTIVTTTTKATDRPVDLKDVCSLDDYQQLLDWISRDVNVVQNTIQDVFQQYMISSLHSINTLVQYSNDRSTYDYNYFIGIKIQSALSVLDQFTVLLPMINVTSLHLRVTVELRNALQELLDAIHGAHVQIETLTIRLYDFETSINALYINYMNLYRRFDAIQGFVSDFLPLGITLPNYFDISDIPLPNTLLPIKFNVPTFNVNLPNIEILTNSYLEKVTQLIASTLVEVTQDITEQAQETVNQLIETLRGVMQLDDYNPPKYPSNENMTIPSDEIDYMTGLAETSKSDVTNWLDTLYQRHTDDPIEIDEQPSADILRNVTFDDTTSRNFTVLDILYPTELKFLPSWILAVITFILSNNFIIECMTQAYRLRNLKRKYERDATPDLPNIDYVVEENNTNDAVNEKSYAYKVNVVRMVLLKNIMNPWVLVGLVLVPFVIVIFASWFPHVKRTCIDSRRGTYFARNIWKQININRANSAGFTIHNIAQTQCYSRQRYVCNSQMMISDTTSRSDKNTVHALQTRFNESNTLRNLIGRCVATDILDNLFSFHCCGLEGYGTKETCLDQQEWNLCPIDKQIDPPSSFRPFDVSLSDQACDVYPTIDEYAENASFDCSTIQQTCADVPCTGVDEQLIEMMTIEADCSIEIYGIQICIFVAVAVYHAIMINVINRLLFNGILQIRWKRLKPDGITLITSIDSDGQLTKGNDQQERAELVQRVMKQYVRTGYVQVGFGLIAFLFWLVTLLVIRRAASQVTIYQG